MKGRATTPEAKRAVIERLLAAWMKQPEWRLGQLIENSLGPRGPATFYVEDEDLARYCEEMAK